MPSPLSTSLDNDASASKEASGSRALALASLLALALAPPSMIATRAVPGAMMIAGVLLFSGDLATRIATGGRLFANAAPSGGMMLMAGWLALAVCAVIAFLRRPR